ncbi:MAG: Transcription elongation factor GreA [Candidatus Magasanikbacteria bacterium GW2011_GWA2_37_8]|uniref:Transcription elongation factor GreA n=1 Tax=Candidatus Magasanikbacteria bacterium GW2011_GWA2_37_8 TaxID=1619036 RepID=A0A0G0KKT5_9BACT|nr:MAG: Transcription elongation factor GreA [Candidatus Magasanikbacteria bacterium GW2011_GWA2_37_8]
MTDNNIQYLTAESLETLQSDVNTLKNKTIPDIAKRIDEAKQQGDLSENAEYHQAREDMSWAQGKLRELEQILENYQLITKTDNVGVVSVGSTAVVKVNGTTKEYTIVGPQEIDPAKGYISNESPIGTALIGARKKDKVEVSTPAGKLIYEIIEIK